MKSIALLKSAIFYKVIESDNLEYEINRNRLLNSELEVLATSERVKKEAVTKYFSKNVKEFSGWYQLSPSNVERVVNIINGVEKPVYRKRNKRKRGNKKRKN